MGAFKEIYTEYYFNDLEVDLDKLEFELEILDQQLEVIDLKCEQVTREASSLLLPHFAAGYL